MLSHRDATSPWPLLRASALLGLAATAGAPALAQGLPVDLSLWTAIQYEFNFQPDASWDLQPGNTAVLQSVNADASIYLSDFDSVGQEITGTWSVETNSDDDFMGFVFGYQDRGHFYLFDWKQADQNFVGTFAEAGMTLKVVNMPAGQDPEDVDLWPTMGSPNVTMLAHNTIPWADRTEYEFTLSFVPGTIEITVREGTTVLESWSISDSTYTDGEFGFYNYSQGDVLYQGFTRQGVPELYCVPKVNSEGCTPFLATTGYASMTDTAAFDITATMLINNQFSTLMWSLAGRDATPFGGGTLCIGTPFANASIELSGGSLTGTDCSGQYSIDFNSYLQAGGTGILVGDTVDAQVFYRDPMHSDGTGFGLTEAVEFVILP